MRWLTPLPLSRAPDSVMLKAVRVRPVIWHDLGLMLGPVRQGPAPYSGVAARVAALAGIVITSFRTLRRPQYTI